MKERICSMVRDIKPLYMKKEISEETKSLVDTHLNECSECSTYYKSETGKENCGKDAQERNAGQKENIDTPNTKELAELAARLRKRRRRIIAGIVAGVLVLIIVFTQIIQTQVVGSNGMAPTYEAGDAVMVNRMAYTFSSPKRGDVIVYTHQDFTGIKRIIGLPGETVTISGGKVLIDGKELSKDYITEPIPSGDTEAIVLKEEEYFVLGDNAVLSHDSRYAEFGPLTEDEIIGKVLGKGLSIFTGVVSESQSVSVKAE